ncbi:3-oxoacyl-[acyl-carrier-protein] synthase III C-terminal domain-containing protein [Frankia sp. CpI1-P]|uniref:3-oxoacyl-[acyl-carrier-protein] synthase III C-terminal domain-containing protein n=1 Tax=Frankia sp. CpI1-P TaxID=1502734 RepID=UPI002412BAF8|nr:MULTISPECIES: 3-oxoacyl-[acyl-carrier-protein] synthase III C-terminal domain-containing protein [Frankia]
MHRRRRTSGSTRGQAPDERSRGAAVRLAGGPGGRPGDTRCHRHHRVTLDDAVRAGRLDDGSTVLLLGFGGGMTWGSVLLRWHA